jgi:hypothetical protein
MPVVGVFISFTDGPYVVDPNWVEVTQYVRDINVRRGRGNDLQQFPSGSANLTLDNRTRLFDPFNTAGIYYGNLKPRRQIKIVGQWAGVTYPIFRGFIAGFPVGYSDGGKDSTVQIDCFDALGLLASEAATDYLDTYTRSLSPTGYWKCNDPISQYDIEYTTGTGRASYYLEDFIGTNRLRSTKPFSKVDALLDSLIAQAVNTETYSAISNPTIPPATGYASSVAVGDLSISMWLSMSPQRSVSSTSLNFWGATGYLSGDVISIYFNTNGSMYVQGSATTLVTTSVQNLNSDAPIHVVVTYSYTTGLAYIYINGIDVSSGQVAKTNLKLATINYVELYGMKFQEIATYNRVITTTEITELYNLSLLKPFETTAVRAARILAQSQFSPTLTSLTSTPTATVGDLPINETTLNELQQVNSSEVGALYVTSSGVLTFKDRQYFGTTRSAVSQATFTDTGTGVYYDYSSIKMGYNADLLRNKVLVQFSGAGAFTTQNTTSITDYGEAGETLNTNIDSAANAYVLGNFYITIYKNPKLGVEPFMVKGQRNPSYDWPRLLSLELLDRFTFVRTPSTGSAISQDMLLQSIEHRITPGTWETVVNGSARFTGWFIIGTSLIGGTDVLL